MAPEWIAGSSPATTKESSECVAALDQLKKIFSAPLYTGCKDDQAGYAVPGPSVVRRARFFVPLLALFAGLRLNEACQLALDDVAKMDGVDVLVIRPDAEAGQTVKTASARRIVPVHGELVRCGFLEFVARQRKAGHGRLFVELEQDSRGRFADAFEKWFNDRGRFLEKAGAKAPKTSFHYRSGQDVLGQFLADRCVVEPGATVTPTDLRRSYTSWCEERGDIALGGRRFRAELLARGCEHRGERSDYGHWHGLRLRTPDRRLFPGIPRG